MSCRSAFMGQAVDEVHSRNCVAVMQGRLGSVGDDALDSDLLDDCVVAEFDVVV